MSESSSTATAPGSPATEVAQAAASATPTATIDAPQQTQPEAVDDIDLEWEAHSQGKTVEEVASSKQTKDKPPAKTDPSIGKPESRQGDKPGDATKDKSDDAGATDTNLSDEDKQAIRRHKLNPDEIEVMRALSPESRRRFIDSLNQRATFTDDLQRKLKEREAGKQAEATDDKTTETETTQQQAHPATAPAFDTAWSEAEKALRLTGLEDAEVGAIKSAMQAAASAQTQQLTEQNQALAKSLHAVLERQMNDDIEAGFEALELPDGIDKNDPKVREQLKAEAEILLNGSFDLHKFNYRHAIERAATNLFHKQLTEAEKARKARESKQARKGAAEPSTASPTAKPALDEDAFEDEALKAVLAGDRDKLARLTA